MESVRMEREGGYEVPRVLRMMRMRTGREVLRRIQWQRALTFLAVVSS
jgi:aspartate oxidase